MFEYSIQELADGMRLGRWTSRSLIEEALRRVAQRDQSGPCLNSIAEINPEALWIADGLDREGYHSIGRGYKSAPARRRPENASLPSKVRFVG